MEKLRVLLENRIQEQFSIAVPEWVQVDISRSRNVHVTLVTDQNLTKDQIRDVIRENLQHQDETYTMGFVDIYSCDQAREFNLEKQPRNDKLYTWADGLNADVQDEEDTGALNVISFYSYKGGVGRTVALIQTAYNLAKAGKRVALLDLDIEAPSLHNLFSNRVNDEVSGVKYGMIEYLYRVAVQKRVDISLSDVYCSLQLSNIDGSMFLIPAVKSMNKKYIYQIGRLQTEQIHDEEIFQKFFDEIQRELAVDFVLIDTRAGFNAWGSLSLLALSTQVIFVAYPNSENIEGLNIAFEMMENVGKKRYAVAMSKIVSSDEGLKRSQKLFDELKISQDALIPIFYREEIALNNEYPITSDEASDVYRELSDYLLDNERIVINRDYLSNGVKQSMLKNLFQEKKSEIVLSGVSRFMRQDAQVLMVYRFAQELYGIRERSMQELVYKDNMLLPVNRFVFFSRGLSHEYHEILKNDSLSPEQMGLEIIHQTLKQSFLKIDEILSKNEQWSSVGELRSCLKKMVSKDDAIFFIGREQKQSAEKYEVFSRISIFISITEDFLLTNAGGLIENIKALVTMFNKNIPEIQFKFLITNDLWKKNQELFGGLKGVTLELDVESSDIRTFLCHNVNANLFYSYIDAMQVKGIPRESGEIYSFDEERVISDADMITFMELILGIRKDIRTYSASVSDYIYNFLEDNSQICYDRLLDCLKYSVQDELKSIVDQADDRLISFCNLERNLNRLIANEI